jgi:hypothetical protein
LFCAKPTLKGLILPLTICPDLSPVCASTVEIRFIIAGEQACPWASTIDFIFCFHFSGGLPIGALYRYVLNVCVRVRVCVCVCVCVCVYYITYILKAMACSSDTPPQASSDMPQVICLQASSCCGPSDRWLWPIIMLQAHHHVAGPIIMLQAHHHVAAHHIGGCGQVICLK